MATNYINNSFMLDFVNKTRDKKNLNLWVATCYNYFLPMVKNSVKYTIPVYKQYVSNEHTINHEFTKEGENNTGYIMSAIVDKFYFYLLRVQNCGFYEGEGWNNFDDIFKMFNHAFNYFYSIRNNKNFGNVENARVHRGHKYNKTYYIDRGTMDTDERRHTILGVYEFEKATTWEPVKEESEREKRAKQDKVKKFNPRKFDIIDSVYSYEYGQKMTSNLYCLADYVDIPTIDQNDIKLAVKVRGLHIAGLIKHNARARAIIMSDVSRVPDTESKYLYRWKKEQRIESMTREDLREVYFKYF